jgi:hypothetical protein
MEADHGAPVLKTNTNTIKRASYLQKYRSQEAQTPTLIPDALGLFTHLRQDYNGVLPLDFMYFTSERTLATQLWAAPIVFTTEHISTITQLLTSGSTANPHRKKRPSSQPTDTQRESKRAADTPENRVRSRAADTPENRVRSRSARSRTESSEDPQTAEVRRQRVKVAAAEELPLNPT